MYMCWISFKSMYEIKWNNLLSTLLHKFDMAFCKSAAFFISSVFGSAPDYILMMPFFSFLILALYYSTYSVYWSGFQFYHFSLNIKSFLSIIAIWTSGLRTESLSTFLSRTNLIKSDNYGPSVEVIIGSSGNFYSSS